jgi:isoleucyl-tRNA synthetase
VQQQEEEILEFWKKNKIYEKSKKKNEKGKKFYMMDGPPYATGHIHMGTALNKTLKDVAMRAKRLQGYNVFDRAGYDTHGVPIEFKIEKEIGSKSKQDIEIFGVKKFIEKCKEFATQYIDTMNFEFENLGVWMNFSNPYLTLSDEYIETIWDTFKVADEKGLLYLGKYPIHVCPRCETALAYNEIEYAKQKDNSIFVKFPLKKKKNTFLIIWTTTPWTLPGNTGVMANPDVDYQELELSSGERWILAKPLVGKIMGQLELGFNVKEEFKGKKMEGWEYENPLSKNLNLKIKNGYKVILSSRYVTTEDGTGLVHCAPGHGKEDYEVGKEYGIDMPSPVDINGNLTKEAGKYGGKKARVVDKEIIEDLEKDGKLVWKMEYEHDYPLCWRCKSSLLMVSQPQWFLKISEIHKKIMEENEETNWTPNWMKLRMQAWLEGVSDWPVSRKRYWGTPLPIWICSKCEKRKVIGSIEELKKLSKAKKIGVHKPEIDEIKIKCSCGGEMKRVPEVLDVWFDSGVSSWAALNKDEKKKFWPADLNIEGKDQIRGWWNSQLILSTIKFDKKPFELISVHGMVLDLGKKKMSKSLGNFVSPSDIINKYGRDYLRLYLTKTSKGEDFAFDEEEVRGLGNFFRVLLNLNNFANQISVGKKKIEVEDKWILSRLANTIKEVKKGYDEARFYDSVSAIEKFVVNDFSKTYIPIVRDRSEETGELIKEIRNEILKMLAPICPFITERLWQELKALKEVKEESIHLSLLEERKGEDKELEKEFALVLKVIELGLSERDKQKIGLKWPLAKASVCLEENLKKELQEIIARQLNVKKVEVKKAKEISVVLDLKQTEELETEGFAREIARNIQAGRKNAGLVKNDVIEIQIFSSLNERLKKQEEFLQERVGAKKVFFGTSGKNFDKILNFKVKEIDFEVKFNKLN